MANDVKKEYSTEFEGQTCLVTGGAGGIGLYCAKELLQRGMKKMAILDKMMNQDTCLRLIKEYGKERVIFVRCDVTNAQEFENAFKIVMNNFQQLDVVINNAGILDDADWEKEIQVNLHGVIRGTLLALQHMSYGEGGQGGSIVNISSLGGVTPTAGCPVYNAISQAIIGLTSSFALPFHYTRTGVKMMTLCPGITYTKIISGASKKMISEETGKEWLKELSMTATQKYSRRPDNVAQAVAQMLLVGQNGSIWISEAGQSPYEINRPSHQDLKKQTFEQNGINAKQIISTN